MGIRYHDGRARKVLPLNPQHGPYFLPLHGTMGISFWSFAPPSLLLPTSLTGGSRFGKPGQLVQVLCILKCLPPQKLPLVLRRCQVFRCGSRTKAPAGLVLAAVTCHPMLSCCYWQCVYVVIYKALYHVLVYLIVSYRYQEMGCLPGVLNPCSSSSDD